mmetsp:Transcript_14895/g.22745  ORF Transcript_14895/g.22745 Transcript_14895/m.22745 type:complete len:794 (+) Transcript_14895:182-2563(+)
MTRLLILVSVFFGFLLSNAASSSSSKETPSLLEPFRSSFVSPDYAGCVTLYKRGRAEGCGTMSRDVQSGIIVEYNNDAGRMDQDYVVLLPESYLTRENIETILAQNNGQGRLQGILITNETLSSSRVQHNPSAMNPLGKKTPSQAQTYGNDYPWNPYGQKLVHLDFQGTPMVYLRDNEVGKSLQSSGEENSGNHAVKASFNYYMGPPDADMDSIQCLQWQDAADGVWRPKCLPLGGHSVWSRVVGQQSDDNNNNRRSLLDEKRLLEENNDNNNNQKPLLMVTARMDAMSLFHDLDFGANQAASNIMAIMLAAKMIGQVSDFSSLGKEIVFSLFQGESFGYLGSRRFLLDILGFECKSDPVPSVSKNQDSGEMACLYPLRPSLEFSNLNGNNIAGMLVVDQIGVLTTKKNFYVHADKTDFGAYLTNILVGLSNDDGYTISESYIESDDDEYPLDEDDVTLPPTPLISLLSVTNGASGGAILAGYDNAFVTTYGSRHDVKINYSAIAAAATTLARATVAAAYGEEDDDYETALAYAMEQIPDALSSKDDFLLQLGSCLTNQANCQLLKQYASMEAKTEAERTGLSMGIGSYLGRSDAQEGVERSEANYYVSVFSGQPYVTVGNSYYGAYHPEDAESKYGKDSSDAFSLQPSLLEQAVRGMLNDFLGRPSNVELKSCQSTKDCNKVEYCSSSSRSICTGGNVCVCGPQAHYHLALDEGLEATPNERSTGYFTVLDGYYSALYTEPFWDNHVGVQIYVDSLMPTMDYVTLGLGLFLFAASWMSGRRLRAWLRVEKLF